MLEQFPSLKSVERLLVGRSRAMKNKNKLNFWTQAFAIIAIISMIQMSSAQDENTDKEDAEEEESLINNLKSVEWWRWILIFFLICLSGCFSGLNLGVLGLDCKDLEMMQEGPFETLEDEKLGKHAKKLLPLRRRGNLLLCAILLGNVMVNSLLSILMADIAGGAIGLVSSTGLIVIFGEIVPQAICTRHGVVVGSYLSILLWITIGVTFIFAFPIAAILDKLLDEEVGMVMTKTKMKKFFDIQQDMNMIEE